MVRDCTSRKQEEHWQSLHGQRQAKELLKSPSAVQAKELLNLSQNPLRIMMELLTGHCCLNRWTIPGVINANRQLKWPCMFLVTVRYWPHYDLGTWVSIL